MHREHEGSVLSHRRLASTQAKHDVCLDRRFTEGGSGDILSWTMEKGVGLGQTRVVGEMDMKWTELRRSCGGDAEELRSCGEAT